MMESNNSPTTVATDLMNIKHHLGPDADKKFQRPPMRRASTERFNRSSSMPDSDTLQENLASADRPKDDIDALRQARTARRHQHQTLADFKGKFSISQSTRNILGGMDENQLKCAKVQLEAIQKQRRSSGLDFGLMGLQKKQLSISSIEDAAGTDNDNEIRDISSSIGSSSSSKGSKSNRRSSRRSSRRGSDESLDDSDVVLGGEEGRVYPKPKRGSRRASQSDMILSSSLQRQKDELSDEESSDDNDNEEGGDEKGSGRSLSNNDVVVAKAKANKAADRRRMSKSVGAMGNDAYDLRQDMHGFTSDESDDEEQMSAIPEVSSNNAEGVVKAARKDRRRMSKSLGASQDESHDIRDDKEEDNSDDASFEGEKELQKSLGQLDQVNEIADKTFAKIVKRHSGDHSASLGGVVKKETDGNVYSMPQSPFPQPSSQRRRPRERRQGMMSTSSSSARSSAKGRDPKTWKPLSSSQVDPKKEEDDDLNSDDENENNATVKHKNPASASQPKGMGGFWNNLTSSFRAEKTTPGLKQIPPFKPPSSSTSSSDNQPDKPKKKKEMTGAAYFRRGKRKANKCQFLQAVALYNFALVRQREESGENHLDCGTTLNEIGVCWMMLGERYPALTAFEEALYIRQKAFGDGAMEVAETTNNIWMILHEERCEMVEEEDEDEEDYEDDE